MQGAQKYHIESGRRFVVNQNKSKTLLTNKGTIQRYLGSVTAGSICCMAVVWEIKAVHDELVPYFICLSLIREHYLGQVWRCTTPSVLSIRSTFTDFLRVTLSQANSFHS